MNARRLTAWLAMVCVTAGLLAGPLWAGEDENALKVLKEAYQASSRDVIETLEAQGNFKTLLAAIKEAGLEDTLRGAGPYTIFAPNDAAWAKLPKGTVDNLLKESNREQLVSILKYHVAAQKLSSKDLLGTRSAKAAQGRELMVEGRMMVDQAHIVHADMLAGNGVVHEIDMVLMPSNRLGMYGREDLLSTAEKAGNFKKLLEAIEAAGLAESLRGKGPFTVFAPTDEAWNALPEATRADLLKPENKARLARILSYHVVPRSISGEDIRRIIALRSLAGPQLDVMAEKETIRVGGAEVTKADIATSNGTIHVINKVLLPPERVEMAGGDRDILATAERLDNLRTFVKAVRAAGLADTLQGAGTFTVFAPSNEAFSSMPPGELDDLLKPENRQKLADILRHHLVTTGRLTSKELGESNSIKTLHGENLGVNVQFMVNGARIQRIDIPAGNGVIHIIDRVLVP